MQSRSLLNENSAHVELDNPNMVVNCVAYHNSGRRIKAISIEAISDVLHNHDTFIWLGLHEPDETLLWKIQQEFGLHELAIEDAQHAHQRPKIEIYDDVLFVVLHTAQFVGGKVQFGETHIFMGKRFLITVRHGASLSYAGARARCEQTPDLLALGPSFGLYAVIDSIVDNFFPIVESFQASLRELEEEIFRDEFDRETIKSLYRLKRELVNFRLAVAPLQDILNQLVRFHQGLVHDEVRVYYRDVFDHAVRMNETINTLGEMLTAALQLNLSLVSLGQNDVVKRLAGWAGLLTVPTLIASIYGMNFDNMPELHWRYGYWMVLGVTVLICSLLYWRLKKANYL
jgi:magnesium transporter